MRYLPAFIHAITAEAARQMVIEAGQIAKAETMVTRLQQIEEKRAVQAEETRKQDDKKTTYIS